MCVFPFIVGGETYNECTTEGKSTPWCATTVDADGNYKDNETCITSSCYQGMYLYVDEEYALYLISLNVN